MTGIVKDLPFFKDRGMAETTLIEVVNCMSLLQIKRNKVVMEYGDVGDMFYFMLRGSVEI